MVHDSSSTQTLSNAAFSAVVPVYNEAPHLASEIRRMVEGLRTIGYPFELVVCENGSTDGSREIADQLNEQWPELVVEHLTRADYGLALKHAIATCRHECVVIYNLDFWDIAFTAEALRRLERCDVVVGSKVMDGAADRRPWLRRAITRSFNAFLRALFGFHGTDTHGMKAFRRVPMAGIAAVCETDGWIFDTELILRAERQGLTLAEIPVNIREIRQPGYLSILRRIPEVLTGLRRLGRALNRAKDLRANGPNSETSSDAVR